MSSQRYFSSITRKNLSLNSQCRSGRPSSSLSSISKVIPPCTSILTRFPSSNPSNTHRNRFSTSAIIRSDYQPTAEFQVSPLSPQQYTKIADSTLEHVLETFESLLETSGEGGESREEWDLESASGVMNFRLGSHGTYVINKQPPNSQIWLSSPSSGPSRFDYSIPHKTWFSRKEGRETITLRSVLEKELGEIFEGEEVRFGGEDEF